MCRPDREIFYIMKNGNLITLKQDFQLTGTVKEHLHELTEQSETIKVNTNTFDELQKQIAEIQREWNETDKFFVKEFTKRLRCVVYYQINHRNFDRFYWYCYNAARQYLQIIENPIDKEGKPVDINKKLEHWIEDYKKEYPSLLPESQALVTEQFSNDYVMYQKQFGNV